LRVLSTRRSESFRWCHAEGISRFLARPILSRDRLFGALIAVDFRLRPPLFGSGPEPGAEEALALAVQAAAAAFHEIAQREALSRQAEEARAQRRLAERHEHDAANLELCRRASRALAGELAGLADALGGAGAAAPGDRSAEPTDALQSRLARALDILDEIDALADQGPARLRVASLNDVIAEVVERFRSGAGGTRAEISLRADGDIPRLLLDTDRIRDLITNLIDHGLSGTEERRGEITTRLQKGQVVAELRFPGRSAPGGAIESLFAPFGLDDATGFSLGLSLADQLVREHGGQLRVRSEPGEGLSYWLSLPVRENQERRRRRPDRRGGLDRRRS
jgi:signal transduction histidine kinase